MKTLKLLTSVLLLSLFSCDEDERSPSNEIIINGESIPLVNGYYFDIEAAELTSGRILHGTHYAQSFILTDGILTVSEGELICNDCTFEVFIEANSAGASSFTSDDFNSEDSESTQLTSTAEESYLFLTAESTNESTYFTSAPSGTISIGVNQPNFTFNFDLTVTDKSDGIADAESVGVSGRFKGAFEEMDARLLSAEH